MPYPNWTKQELDYFAAVTKQKNEGTYNADNHNRYLTQVSQPQAGTGQSQYVQGVDPIDVAGGYYNKKLQADIAAQVEADKRARERIALDKGVAVGRVDGENTLDSVQYANSILSNPQNVALAEQQRRGHALGPQAGETVSQYLNRSMGDKKLNGGPVEMFADGGLFDPNSDPNSPFARASQEAAAKNPSALGGLTPEAARAFAAHDARSRVTSSLPPASPTTPASSSFDPNGYSTNKEEAYGGAGLASSFNDFLYNWRQQNGGVKAGDSESALRAFGDTINHVDWVGNQVHELKKELLAGQDINDPQFRQRIADTLDDLEYGGIQDKFAKGKFSPEETDKVKSDILGMGVTESTIGDTLNGYQPSWAVNAQIANPTYFEKQQAAQDSQKASSPGSAAAKGGQPPASQSSDRNASGVSTKGIDNSNKKTEVYKFEGPDGKFYKSKGEANRARIADVATDPKTWLGSDEKLFGLDPTKKDFWLGNDNEFFGVGFKSGGQKPMVLGGQPHFIVDSMGNPVAAITEDGKEEAVKPKGKGVEVIPMTEPRHSMYQARKKAGNVPGFKWGGFPLGPGKEAPTTGRVGSQSGNTNRTKSGNTAKIGKSMTARRSSASDGRVRNGKTNNGRPSSPDSVSPVTGSKDAQNVLPPVRWKGTGPLSKVGAPVKSPLMQPRGGMSTGQPQLSPVDGNSPNLTPVPGVNLPLPMPQMGIPANTTIGAPVASQPIGQFQPLMALEGGMIPAFAFGGMTGTGGDLNTGGWDAAYANRDAKYNTGNDSADRWAWLAAGRPTKAGGAAQQPRPQVRNPSTGTPSVNTGAGASVTTNPQIQAPAQVGAGGPNFVGSGGNRVIDNSVGGAKFGFDATAPVDIAANSGRRNVVNNPGVSVLQPWKFAPRTLQNLGESGRQMLQSQWNATGGAPDELFGRGQFAQPRTAGLSRS